MKNFDFTGIWQTRYLIADIVIHVEQKGRKVSGYAEVFGFMGSKDLYHFLGEVNGMNVHASHYKGRRFVGKALGKNSAAGILTTISGSKLSLKAKRVSMNPQVI
ncbi:hypothetical protein [Pseudodesulfovibrio methanolicus]|uniref:Uncharacterized protein n=1 Tax=Pseudodesulfovibrio methanolicus TaxID=3126690 RepID=A0ABZ2IYT6_9BACT